MATTTNYGWAEPDNTSLVKNGAQDIRILGDAIDASVWNIGYGQAGKNKIINGDFGIWQRGTSFTLTNEAYTADRFKTQTDKTGTISRQTFTAGTAPVAGYESQFYLRSALNAVGSYYILNQPIEDVRTFAGNTVTMSFWARVSSGTVSNAPEIVQNFGSGGSASVTTSASSQTITTTWQRFSVSVAIPSITGKTIGTSSSLEIRVLRFVSAAAATIDIWGVQVEYGSKATPFETASGSIQGELAMCQRYYYRNTQTGSGTGITTNGGCVTTTIGQAITKLPTTMRVNPTAIEFSGINWYNYGNNTEYNTGTFTMLSATPDYVGIRYTHGSAIFTAGQVGGFTSGSGTTYIGFSAELQEMTMDEVTFFTDELDGKEHAIIDRGNGEFTSMLKSTYDELKANEAAAE